MLHWRNRIVIQVGVWARQLNIHVGSSGESLAKTVFFPTFHRGCTQFWGFSESAGPSWESLWSHWWNKWPLVLDFLSPHSYALQRQICKIWVPTQHGGWRWQTSLTLRLYIYIFFSLFLCYLCPLNIRKQLIEQNLIQSLLERNFSINLKGILEINAKL